MQQKKQSHDEKMRERQARLERTKKEQESLGRKKKLILFSALIVVLLAASTAGAFYYFTPSPWDDFAKCLTENGAVMKGEDWCQYTKAQKNMFGKSFKHITYEIDDTLRIRPTWVINGQEYETVQSFERLAALTGCEIQPQ